MLARQRQARILEQVQRDGGVRVSELTRILGVSDMTVRRDLDVLAADGLVEKVHGGATAIDDIATDEPGFEAKSAREQAEKHAIAVAAAGLVRSGTAIAVTAGTTTWALARRLGEVSDLTIVTNSVRVADELHHRGRRDHSVILTGGLRTPSDALVGPVAEAAIRSLHVDQVFMGVHGMDERSGFTTPNLMEASTNRAFAESARRLVVLADHTKWGVVGLSQIVPLHAADTLVTDDRLPQGPRTVVDTLCGHVVYVSTDSSTGRAQ